VDKDFTMRLLKTLPHLMNKMFHDINEFRPLEEDFNLGLNKTQRKTLLILYSDEGMNMSRFCRILNLEKGSFTSVIDSLIEQDLVIRQRDNDDRRKIFIRLSKKGKEFVEQIVEIISSHIEHKLSVLSKEDFSCFIHAIDDLSRITEKLGK
jgi:DNA-binding MarR family transcriptional regulator